jgi:acyl-CoA thioesterase
MEFSSKEMSRLNSNSLYQALGIVVEEAKGGKARSKLRPVSAFCWPFEGQPHGGVLFTLMDTTMAWAVLTRLEQGYNCATINLDIQYTKRAGGDILTCQAWVTHKATRIIYVRADILDTEGQLAATGQGTFKVIKAPL